MSGLERRFELSRRGLITAGAWSVPVVALAVATPALAASLSNGTTFLGQATYTSEFTFGNSTTVVGEFTLIEGTTFPTGDDVLVIFDSPIGFSLTTPIAVNASTGAFTFAFTLDSFSSPPSIEATITVSAPGFTGATSAIIILA